MSIVTASSSNRMRFSGHESFICRLSWLRKGLRFVSDEGNFNADEAVMRLGVGKNMVGSIRYWLRAFGLTEEPDDTLSPFGSYLWEIRPAKDPYFEKDGTIWLLHYYLISSGYASIFDYFFHEFAVGRLNFTEEQLFKALHRKCIELKLVVADNSLDKDISILLRTLLKPTSRGHAKGKTDIEEVFSGVLADLGLLKSSLVERMEGKHEEVFSIVRDHRPDLPWQVVLHCIMGQLPEGGSSVSFKDMMHSPNSPGLVFLLSRDGLFEKIEEITKALPEKAIFSQTAGNEVLQLSTDLNLFDPLNAYYAN
jgi:hypothetical protein